jgi:PKD repeat protein
MSMARSGVISAVIFCALAFPLSAFAGLKANTPICSLRVNPTSGGSPLTVDTTGSDCFEFDDTGQPVPLTMTITWGDKSPDSPGPVATHTFVNGGIYTVTLTGTDPNGTSATASQDVTVFGPSCTLTVKPTTGAAPLTVTATGACQNSLEDTLDWGDGTVEADTSSGTHTYSTPGTYTVTLTGVDDSGNTGQASQTVTVTVNSPPTCTLAVNPNTGPTPLTVTATGDCTDPDNDIVFTSLNWGDGTIENNVTSGTHTYTVAGTYTVTVTADDAVENSGSASQRVVVTPPVNQPPTCTLNVAPTTGVAPLMVTAAGSCTDPEGKLVSTSLDWGDGTTQTSPSGTHTYTAAGTYNVTVMGTDDRNQSGSASRTVTVTANQPPACTLTISPSTGDAPVTVTATGNCTDPEKNLASTTLNWGDGTTQTQTSGTHTYTTPGTYTVTVSATDGTGQTATATRTEIVTQANRPPACTLSITPASGNVPLAVTATGACTDPDNNLTTTILAWGDGTQQTTPSGPHTYSAAGTFTAMLTGTDAKGLTSSATATVTVTASAVFLGASGGHVLVLNADGSTARTLDTTLGGTITGMAFDGQNTLYVTDFTAGNITRFSTSGALTGNFGSGFDCQPESATFDKSGNLYVGLAGCKKNVLKFSSSGNLVDSYSVAIEDQGADWVDLSADGCTLFYTSEGHQVFRYNVCGKQQLGNFSAGFHRALAIRILPDGGVLVADNEDIHRTDAAGVITKTYDQAGENCWVTLTLDPDGKTFWAADACTSHIYQMDIAAGTVVKMLSPTVPANSVFGIGVSGQSAANNSGALAASPSTQTATAGGSVTFSVTFQASGVTGPQLLTCSNLPVGVKCSFNPPTITNGGSSTLTITTNNQTSTAQNARPSMFFAFFAGSPFIFSLILVSKQRRRMWISLLAVAVVIVLIACGTMNTNINGELNPAPLGTPQLGNTPPGTYTIGVNAGNGPIVSTTSITLTVK